jgi:(1->4)-alpha-D-glucan 1-alpha-D-glucosylmutase
MPDNLLDRLAADTIQTATARWRVPGATYRLQMHGGFTFQDAARITGYLHSLGITHVYTSSLLAAKPGSTHGYDVMNHEEVNPEIGTESEFAAWVTDLQVRGMGVILDTVPNHMSVGCDNAWWNDVLEHGPSSPYADYFDIAWTDHPRERLHGKVLLPILGDPYGQMLESGEFRPVFDNGAFFIKLYDRRLPVDPRTYGLILAPALDTAREELGGDADGVVELQSILTSVKHLPTRDEPDPNRVAEGRIETAVIKRRLAELGERFPEVNAHVCRAIHQLGGLPGESSSFDALDQLLDAQAYRPCYWRVASDEINYRRFFDINDLAALSTEREEVFRAIHSKLFDWLGAGLAVGLRIDHPDGLFDPKQYLERLQIHFLLACAKHLLNTRSDDYTGLNWDEAETALREQFVKSAPKHLYVVVEKILGRDESIPDDWVTHGTTGYEFLNMVNGMFVDLNREEAITRVYQDFTGQYTPFDEIVYRKKFLILQSSLSSELHMLAHQLDRLAQAERWSRDFTLNGLRHALREVIASFPVYRSYVNGGVRDTDRIYIQRAVRKARARNPLLGRRVFDFIRDTLLLRDPPSGPATDEYRAAQQRFAGKFQQVTSPVMAKGLEDTTFYVYNRLVSLNEVGGEPGHFGMQPTAVHRFFRERSERFPGGLSPLATHDTKRGEDIRARINVLSEIPQEWQSRLHKWAELNNTHKVELEDGVLAPDRNEEYFLYQTLVGAWPLDAKANPDSNFVERIKTYMNKALHEAKVHTSWINPDAEYDEAVTEFINRILDSQKSEKFLADLREFHQTVSHFGIFNSLAQTLIRCTAPGVPDTYQGTELWDFSLVDPDNRRPVDYEMRERLLRELDERATGDRRILTRELIEQKEDGRVKLFTVSRALRFRRDHPELFSLGRYEPVMASGQKADHIFAFLRYKGEKSVLIVVPRLIVSLLSSCRMAPIGPEVWQDTQLELPKDWSGREWENIFTGERIGGDKITAASILADFPIGFLTTI